MKQREKPQFSGKREPEEKSLNSLVRNSVEIIGSDSQKKHFYLKKRSLFKRRCRCLESVTNTHIFSDVLLGGSLCVR